ncbi:MAG: DUF3592 domain-containing protein [Legionellales bacterium]
MVLWHSSLRWILDLGWLIFLLLMAGHFWKSRQDLARAQTWLKATGRITDCEWTQVGHSIWPKIEYSYQVYDKDLVGHYLFLDTAHNNPNSKYARSVAYKVAVAFKEHSDIDVYYNPNQPEQSALDITIPTKLQVILVILVALIVVHVSLIVLHYMGRVG